VKNISCIFLNSMIICGIQIRMNHEEVFLEKVNLFFDALTLTQKGVLYKEVMQMKRLMIVVFSFAKLLYGALPGDADCRGGIDIVEARSSGRQRDGNHNHVTTIGELHAYDPWFYNIVALILYVSLLPESWTVSK
jgi:hypothetical protein